MQKLCKNCRRKAGSKEGCHDHKEKKIHNQGQTENLNKITLRKKVLADEKKFLPCLIEILDVDITDELVVEDRTPKLMNPSIKSKDRTRKVFLGFILIFRRFETQQR